MTAQISERIVIDDREFSLLTEPLEPLLSKKRIEFIAPHTACWRGYVGTWKLIDYSLYLIAFNGYKRDQMIDIKDLFDIDSSSPVKAVWFSGKLRIPIGNMVQYVHGGYASSFSEELEIKIKKGKAISFHHKIFHFKKKKNFNLFNLFDDDDSKEYEVSSIDTFDLSINQMIDKLRAYNES